ncbi:MAG: hypothetical protein ACP5D9_10880, partial [Mariniphaga sp.]
VQAQVEEEEEEMAQMQPAEEEEELVDSRDRLLRNPKMRRLLPDRWKKRRKNPSRPVRTGKLPLIPTPKTN